MQKSQTHENEKPRKATNFELLSVKALLDSLKSIGRLPLYLVVNIKKKKKFAIQHIVFASSVKLGNLLNFHIPLPQKDQEWPILGFCANCFKNEAKKLLNKVAFVLCCGSSRQKVIDEPTTTVRNTAQLWGAVLFIFNRVS